jgi:hypothetical protein
MKLFKMHHNMLHRIPIPNIFIFNFFLSITKITTLEEKRHPKDVFFMSFLTLQCIFFCSKTSKKKTPKISELATFSSASSGFYEKLFYIL